MFAYGLLSVIFALFLAEIGLSTQRIGALLTLTLMGDTLISLWMTTSADRMGRKMMLIFGALLMVFAGCLFALSRNFWLLLIAAIIGVISPSGNEVGPFLSIEQTVISQIVPAAKRTGVFAWYNLMGSFAGALGALVGGGLAQWFHAIHFGTFKGYQAIVILYASLGAILAMFFLRLSESIEVDSGIPTQRTIAKRFFGLHESRRVVFQLSALFGLDAFAGGFVMQSLLAYWFYLRFGIDSARLGAIFCAANILAGISALSAAKIAARVGLINTMVFTHIPSNILLILVPLMPNAELAITLLLLRFAISQMDVPTRQAYILSVVRTDERSATAGVTGVARTIGAGLSPMIVGSLLARTSLLSVPFYLAGGLKIVYDLLLYRNFRSTELHRE
jgi:MFS family permease